MLYLRHRIQKFGGGIRAGRRKGFDFEGSLCFGRPSVKRTKGSNDELCGVRWDQFREIKDMVRFLEDVMFSGERKQVRCFPLQLSLWYKALVFKNIK